MWPQQPIKIKDKEKSHMKHRDILNKYFCKDNIQIPTIGPEKIANFHFSHYKSMETIATRVLIRLEIKNTNYVEATVRNMYTKYRIHPLDSF